MTTALVIGGGVAGPVTAMALQKAGIDATVHEARPDAADGVGAYLTLQINGVDALRAVDAYGPVADLGFPTDRMRFRSGTGKVLGEVGLGGELADGTVAVTVRRPDLHRALREEAQRRGIRVEYGHRLLCAENTPDGVRAEFVDGSVAEADLLVGADGIHSRVRRIIDPAAPAARYVPLLNAGGYAPPQPTSARPGSYEMVFGRRAFFLYCVAPDGTVWWGANPPRRDEPAPDELAAISPQEWKRQLLDLFARDRSPACAIIESTPPEQVLTAWATYDIPTVPNWYRNRMVIVGDAAHATTPSSGQGASMALEDAVELARCLRDVPDHSAAFAAFVGLRRERVERVVAHGLRSSSTKIAGPVTRVLRDVAMPLVLRRAGGTLEWMHRHHVDWDAPVTTTGAPAHRG